MQAGLTQAATPPKIKRRSGLANREARWGWFFISPWIIGFLFFTAILVAASLFLSFTEYELITPPQWVGTRNFVDLFTADHLFILSLYNTLYYVLFSVPLSIIFAFVLSMLLNVK